MGRLLRPRSMRSSGFTLVEILVVLVIIAIMVSLVVLSINTTGRDTQLDDESRRVAGLISLLHERAILEGRDFGMRIEPDAYEFVIYDAIKDRWSSFDQEREFRRRTLPKGVTFKLEMDSQVVVLKPIDRSLATDDLPRPQIAIAASGEGTPFRLTLSREGTDQSASVSGNSMGKLTRIGSDHRTESEAGASAASAADPLGRRQ